MQLLTSHNFKSIKDIWSRLYALTPEVSPFLAPEAFEIAYRYFYPYYIIERHFPTLCIFKEDDRVVAIAPLLRCRDGVYRLFVAYNGFNECGMLYEDSSVLPECISLLLKQFGSIEFQKIDERSPLVNFARNNVTVSNNVAIHFGNNYDDWFKSLSSSVRQNIRTAYNRLNKDNLALETRIVTDRNDGYPLNHIIDLYCRRHNERYGVKTSVLKKWFLKHQNFATRLYRFAPNAKTVIIYIDGKPAAFLSGLCTDNRIIVPRLSINNEYRRYSPGMILVNETIKHFIADTSINILDLSLGEEPYKYQLGGTLHHAYRFTL